MHGIVVQIQKYSKVLNLIYLIKYISMFLYFYC